MTLVEMIPGRVYIGGQLKPGDWLFIQHNINVVVNLRTKPNHPPFDFTKRFMIWSPITIREAPSIQWVDQLMKQINIFFNQGYRIVIHDTLGIQRLGFVIAAFYMQRFQLTSIQALTMVRQKKADLKPTDNYMDLLGRYEKFLRDSQ